MLNSIDNINQLFIPPGKRGKSQYAYFYGLKQVYTNLSAFHFKELTKVSMEKFLTDELLSFLNC